MKISSLKNFPNFPNYTITGALIFDEVKVIGKLFWNLKSQHLIGLSSVTCENLSDFY